MQNCAENESVRMPETNIQQLRNHILQMFGKYQRPGLKAIVNMSLYKTNTL